MKEMVQELVMSNDVVSTSFLICCLLISHQVCEVSEQIFYPGGPGTTSADCLTQLPLSTLSKGKIHTNAEMLILILFKSEV